MLTNRRLALTLTAGLILAGLAIGATTSSSIIRYNGPVQVVSADATNETITRHATITDALNSITCSGDHYVVRLPPGTFDEQVTMKSCADIEGAGQNRTTIAHVGSNGNPFFANDPPAATIIGASDAELRDLTVESNASGNGFGIGIHNNGASPDITRVTINVSGATSANAGLFNEASAAPVLSYVSVTVSGGNNAYGLYNENTSSGLTVTHSSISASGSIGDSFGIDNQTALMTMDHVEVRDAVVGVHNDTASSITMRDVTITASDVVTIGVWNEGSTPRMTRISIIMTSSLQNYGVRNQSSSFPIMNRVTIEATGGSSYNAGITNNDSSSIMDNVVAVASGGSSYGMDNSGSGTITMRQSSFTGGTYSIRNAASYTLNIGATHLDGTRDFGTGTWNCAESWDASFDPLLNSCATGGSLLPADGTGDASAPEPPALPAPGE